MPTKRNLKLEDLTVKSFITDTDSDKVKGGVETEFKTICTGPCETVFPYPGCDLVGTLTCAASCNDTCYATCNNCPPQTDTCLPFPCGFQSTPPDMYC